MTTRMTQAPLKLVEADHPNAQRVAILSEPRRLTLGYAEIPEPGDGEIRVRVKWVGVCGSDVEAGAAHAARNSSASQRGLVMRSLVSSTNSGLTSRGCKPGTRLPAAMFGEHLPSTSCAALLT